MQLYTRKEGKPYRSCGSGRNGFTLRYIGRDVVPVSLRLNSGRKDISRGARAIIYISEKQDNEGSIATSRSSLFSLVTTLTIQQKCSEFISDVRESTFILVRDRQISKFIRLINKNNKHIQTMHTSFK